MSDLASALLAEFKPVTESLKAAGNLVATSADLLLKVLSRRCREEVIDHWHRFVPDFQVDPLEFYALVYEELQRQRVPGLKSFCVTHGEGGFGTAHRLYLRMERDWGKFDVCAAPFGTGSFFSYRYVVPTPVGFIAKILGGIVIIAAASAGLFLSGLVSWLIPLLIAPIATIIWIISIFSWTKDTYYKQDSSLMYLAIVPHVIKSLFETVTLQKGVRLENRLTAEGAEV